jgi:serine/threonine protein kinase
MGEEDRVPRRNGRFSSTIASAPMPVQNVTGAVRPSVATIDPDELANRLQVHERLGGGASARVYRATYEGKMVAMKVMHPQSATKMASVQQFLKEAYQLRRCNNRCGIEVLRKD